MNKLFARDVYIRLAGDDSAFVCTVKRCRFFSRLFSTTAEFPLNTPPEPAAEKALIPIKRWLSQSEDDTYPL